MKKGTASKENSDNSAIDLDYELGHSDFVHSFFSTISHHLEKDGWGTKYPLLMDELYHNELSWKDVATVKENLKEIEQELTKLPAELIVWDIESK